MIIWPDEGLRDEIICHVKYMIDARTFQVNKLRIDNCKLGDFLFYDFFLCGFQPFALTGYLLPRFSAHSSYPVRYYNVVLLLLRGRVIHKRSSLKLFRLLVLLLLKMII